MLPDNTISYLPKKKINRTSWDACITQADNGLIYGYSVYLDTMCTHWDALVLNNYEAVMPLPWRRKWGVYYLYSPFAVAQLGVFGSNLTASLLHRFLQAVPPKFTYLDFSLNHRNLFSIPGFPLQVRNNYVLNLSKPYAELYNAYRENIRRNIKKSQGYGCHVKKDIAVEAVVALAQEQSLQHSGIAPEDYQNFIQLFNLLQAEGQAVTYGVLSQKSELLASCVFFFSHRRAYYILVGNHPNGRTLGASHALIDAFIRDYAGQNLWLDFEGSDIRNLAFFYSSFGAVEEPYAAIRLNRLPWYMKWLKQ